MLICALMAECVLVLLLISLAPTLYYDIFNKKWTYYANVNGALTDRERESGFVITSAYCHNHKGCIYVSRHDLRHANGFHEEVYSPPPPTSPGKINMAVGQRWKKNRFFFLKKKKNKFVFFCLTKIFFVFFFF